MQTPHWIKKDFSLLEKLCPDSFEPSGHVGYVHWQVCRLYLALLLGTLCLLVGTVIFISFLVSTFRPALSGDSNYGDCCLWFSLGGILFSSHGHGLYMVASWMTRVSSFLGNETHCQIYRIAKGWETWCSLFKWISMLQNWMLLLWSHG